MGLLPVLQALGRLAEASCAAGAGGMSRTLLSEHLVGLVVCGV